MTRQNINVGSSANDGTGDTLRSAGNKINQNFQEVYTQLGGDSSNLSTLVKLLDSASTGVVLFEGTSADSHETKLIATNATADRTVSLPDKTGTIELLDGLILNSTDVGGTADAGDNIVQNTSANDGDRILLEDATSDPILVLASHGITLSGVGWNTFQFDNDHS